jgi:uncharacterized delta-60 repeat protein
MRTRGIRLFHVRNTFPLSPTAAGFFLLIWFAFPASGAPGDFDPGFGPGQVLNAGVSAAVPMPDGKVLAGGGFTDAGGSDDYITLFDETGALDAGFERIGLLNAEILAIAVLPDGDILVGGLFTNANGNDRILRLNADGSLDGGFNPGTLLSGRVGAIVIQPDGKILVGGNFTNANGNNRLCRLNANGSIDTTFNPGTALNGEVRSIALQEDGSVIVGGQFINANGEGHDRICRFDENGVFDDTFAPGSLLSSTAQVVMLQPDGKVLVGGDFINVGAGDPDDYLCRLNADGTHDETFNPGDLIAGPSATVFGMALQADGKVIVSGGFIDAGGDDDSICRVNADGTHDDTFDPGDTIVPFCDGVALHALGDVICGGGFFSAPSGMGDDNFVCRLDNDPATSLLSATSLTRVQWTRGGSAPEAVWVEFELSTDGGASFTSLGFGDRIAGGWELTGLNLPAEGQLRARALTRAGIYGGSSGFAVETVALSLANPPVVSITGAKTIKTKRSKITIRGTATDPDGNLASVEFIDSRPRGKRFRATVGTASWTATAVLKPGRNIIQVKATDSADLTSAIQRVTVIRK